jgi:hypothetical protein
MDEEELLISMDLMELLWERGGVSEVIDESTSSPNQDDWADDEDDIPQVSRLSGPNAATSDDANALGV